MRVQIPRLFRCFADPKRTGKTGHFPRCHQETPHKGKTNTVHLRWDQVQALNNGSDTIFLRAQLQIPKYPKCIKILRNEIRIEMLINVAHGIYVKQHRLGRSCHSSLQPPGLISGSLPLRLGRLFLRPSTNLKSWLEHDVQQTVTAGPGAMKNLVEVIVEATWLFGPRHLLWSGFGCT